MAAILERAPPFRAEAVSADGSVRPVRLEDYAGRWLVLFFYPRDFTTVCPTELTELSKRLPELAALGAEVLALSVDDLDTHRRWLAEALPGLAFPLAADPGGAVARAYGAFLPGEGVAARATVVIDPAGVVQHASTNNLKVGRSVSELVRVLEGLSTGERVPAEWRPGAPTLGR